jgi:alpha-beta hydrolase superfamily lysophospholipase
MNLLLAILAVVASLAAFCLLAMAILIWLSAAQVIHRRTPDDPSNPADLGLEFEPVSFSSRDGLNLGGWFVPGSEPTIGTVIFCHGHAGSLDPDLKLVPAFHSRGFNVLQFDFRGHGRSEGQHVSMGYYERLDLLAAVGFLQERGIPRVGVLGFSMGGAVAISTAAVCPAIGAVVSDGSFARIQPTLLAGLYQRGMPLWLARSLTPWVLRLVGWWLGCDLAKADPMRWVSRISPRPILLVHGGQDVFVPCSEIERLHAAAGNPKALWIVEEAEHRRIDQICPEQYRARILDFFQRWLATEL